MTFVIGHEKKGGRKKGTKNKPKRGAQDILEEMGCDPIAGMARLAMAAEQDLQVVQHAIDSCDDSVSKGLLISSKDSACRIAGNMYKELAQYVSPKKRAVEVTEKKEEQSGVMVVGSIQDVNQWSEMADKSQSELKHAVLNNEQ